MKRRHVHHAVRRRAIALPVAIVVAALGSAAVTDAAANARMYKCLIGSRTVYQQQACPVDAQPAASATSAVAAASAAREAREAREARLRPAGRAASSVPARPR